MRNSVTSLHQSDEEGEMCATHGIIVYLIYLSHTFKQKIRGMNFLCLSGWWKVDIRIAPHVSEGWDLWYKYS